MHKSKIKIDLELDFRLEFIRFIEGNIIRILHDIEATGIFKEVTPLAKQVKAKIYNWDYFK